MIKIFKRPQLITVDVIYYRPSHTHILQEFIWQTEDVLPDHPRINKFLRYWKENINAIISEVLIAESHGGDFRPVDLLKSLYH
jgi:uncharacterized protein Usg